MSEKSDPFYEMSRRVEAVAPSEFAGAVVIVPPTGDVIAFMMTDPNPSLAQFWSGLEGRVQVAANAAQDAEKQQQAWRR